MKFSMYQLFAILLLTFSLYIETIHCKSRYVFSLIDSPIRTNRPSGFISTVSAKEFPILKGLSMRYVSINSSSIREPHWHANADELGYCLNGSALITIFGNDNDHNSFIVKQGEMYYVPSGYLHHIENFDMKFPAEFIVTFTHELPEDFGLSSTFFAMTNAVLGNTFQLSSNAFQPVEHRQVATVFGFKNDSTKNKILREFEFPNKYHFNAEGLSAKILNSEGIVKTITKNVWPVLKDVSMYSLRITTNGMREPHWHPKTAEMGYVIEGRARMTVLSPGDEQRFETYTLQAGDMYFIPRAYPHHIENIGNVTTRFLVFFDQPVPGDIGLTGSFSAYSRETLAATLDCQLEDLPQFPFYPKSLLIVKRINPVDPIQTNEKK
ncbi:unnamed protein product [Adineta ricciae]|uniref:Cupin type-1 domain-containing protein n=1 Tax=Adineta ricciae TaxID=249248 RepID=A0A816F8V2_ADIRI|nr:unnamed protein product [Adineta ricciae]